MLATHIGIAAPNLGVDVLDASRANRVESVIRRLIKPAFGAPWVLGVFASNGDLLDVAMRGFRLNLGRALGMLCAVPLPESSDLVTMKVTGEDGRLAATIGASMRLDDERSLVLIVVRPATSDKAWPLVAEGLQPAVRRIATLIRAKNTPVPEHWGAAAPQRSDGLGFVVLGPELTIVLRWHPQDDASSELAKLIEPHDGHLPILLERTVLRLTRSWDFARVETCSAAAANPLPGLVLRVTPICGTSVLIGVFLEPHTEHPLERAASAFRISPRERDVLYALFDGHGAGNIAAMLNIAESTVNDHIARMIAKTNAHNRVEMVAKFLGWPMIKAGLTSARHDRELASSLCDATPSWLEATRRARRSRFLPSLDLPSSRT